jgi:mono/diheme cytochrome c family protein
MRKEVAGICFLAWLLSMGCHAKTPQPEFTIPPEEASRVNPLGLTPASVATGNERYLKSDCAVCHGKNGNGKGFMSGASHYDCRDWRDPASLKGFSDGELFYILNKGKGKMPGYEHRIDSEQSWQMIAFIRSLADKS